MIRGILLVLKGRNGIEKNSTTQEIIIEKIDVIEEKDQNNFIILHFKKNTPHAWGFLLKIEIF